MNRTSLSVCIINLKVLILNEASTKIIENTKGYVNVSMKKYLNSSALKYTMKIIFKPKEEVCISKYWYGRWIEW